MATVQTTKTKSKKTKTKPTITSHKANAFLKRNALASKFTRMFKNWHCVDDEGDEGAGDGGDASTIVGTTSSPGAPIAHDLVRALSVKCKAYIRRRYKHTNPKYGSPENIYFCLAKTLNTMDPDHYGMGIDIEMVDNNLGTNADRLGMDLEELQEALGDEDWEYQGPIMSRESFVKRYDPSSITAFILGARADAAGAGADLDGDLDLLSVLAHGEALPLAVAKQLLLLQK